VPTLPDRKSAKPEKAEPLKIRDQQLTRNHQAHFAGLSGVKRVSRRREIHAQQDTVYGGIFRRSIPILLVVLWYCDGRCLYGCIGSDGGSESRPYENSPGHVETTSAFTDNGFTSFGVTTALNLP